MYIDAQTIVAAAGGIAGLGTICGTLFAIYRWYLRQERQDKEIAQMQEEQCLLTYGVLACLKGLKEQGCNGPVTEAIDKIEKHINKKAHEQE